MDVPARAHVTATATPLATKSALVATLGVVAAALGAFERSEAADRPAASAVFLGVFTALFVVRVAGQLVVLRYGPSWLPPMWEWNFVPYRALLPVQAVFVAVMLLVDVALLSAPNAFAQPRPQLGAVLIYGSYAYWAAMAARYARRMLRRPEQRWFGGAIPIVFHCVLAAFVFILGTYHAAG